MVRQRGARGPGKTSTATAVRQRILEAGEDSYFTAADFEDLPGGAVAHALSRLVAAGEIERARKGVYYRPADTALGRSRPSQSIAAARAARGVLQPAGLAAANALGLTTQNPGLIGLATTAAAPPLGMDGYQVRTRRPASRRSLSQAEGAVLEVLRDRAATSDLSPDGTARILTRFVASPSVFERLAAAAIDEPPRVRAMLGALGEAAGVDGAHLTWLHASLNPTSRYDFGDLRGLPTARHWQAK